MSLEFAVEPLRDIWPEWVPLARMHWDETEGYHHGQKFGPDYGRYANYERIGWFKMVTARDGGRLVGYFGCYIVPSMHSQAIIAVEDCAFLHPAARKGSNGIRLYRYATDLCRESGAVEANGTVKLGNQAASTILERLGYERVGLIYSKQLVDAHVFV